ncbi:MAG: N-acetyltransferase family protein [Bacteroidota bacterium]
MASQISIRLAGPAHIPAMLEIYRPFIESTPVSFEDAVPSMEDFAMRIERFQRRHPCLVCLDDDTVAGYAYASPHRARAAYQWAAEVSVYVAETHRKHGVASALYTTLLALLEAQNVSQALAGMTLPNPASEAFHASFGFERFAVYARIGYKFGQWHDVAWMQKYLRDDPDANPLSLRMPGELTAEEWESALSAGLARIKA